MGSCDAEAEVFGVTVRSWETVAAEASPLQQHWLPLSNLDLLLPPLDVGVFFCYEKPAASVRRHTTASMVATLKASLAKALVTYYPFAGEVVANSMGEPELLCNNRGVDFVEAYAAVELAELRLYDPDESVEKKLVPKKKAGVLCVQVTELKSGGLVVGCSFDHRIADAYSANMFLVAWAHMAADRPVSLLPSFRRSLLAHRRPPRPDPSLHSFYVPLSSVPPSAAAAVPPPPAVSRIYFVPGHVIDCLQSEASSAAHRCTKLVAFSSFLWRAIAKAASPAAEVCRLGVVVDGRSRLADKSTPMDGYFGNVLSFPYGKLKAAELAAMELSAVAGTVQEFVQGATAAEHFRGLVDWVEERRPEPAMVRVYCESAEERGPAVIVSSGRRFPVRDVEFGWGSPVFGSYHLRWDSSTGYVMPMPCARGEGGDWVVYVHLVRHLVEALEADAGHVFHPLTADHLGLAQPLDEAGAASPLFSALKLGPTATTAAV